MRLNVVVGRTRSVEFRALGALEVFAGDVPVALPPRQAIVLGALLVADGPLSVKALLTVGWDTEPKNALNALEISISRLRSVLGQHHSGVVIHPPNTFGQYRLSLAGDDCDIAQFRQERASARRQAEDGDWHGALPLYRSAVRRWRGRPLPGRDLPPELEAAVVRLQEEYLTTLLEYADLETDLGEGLRDLVALLRPLVLEHPDNQSLVLRLVRALQSEGRDADARREIRRLQHWLRTREGVELDERLQRLHHELLDPAQAVASAHPGPGAPPPPRFLTGRTGQVLACSDRLRAESAKPPRERSPLVLTGAPGVGKTALAYAVAEESSASFPAGPVFVHLTGHTPRTVLGLLLRRLGVTGGLPQDESERAALLERTIAGRGYLLLLDNVETEHQVRLAVQAPWDGVLLTSRYGLNTLDGRVLEPVDVLSSADAEVLLHALAPESAHDDAAGLARVGELCGRLPLALRIAGALLDSPDRPSPGDLARRLQDERQRLEVLKAGDLVVRAAFQLSYDNLSAAGQDLFRRLGACRAIGLTSVPTDVAATTLDPDRAAGDRAGAELLNAHLADFDPVSAAGRRYRLHDLLGLFAQELFEQQDAREDPLARGTLARRLVRAYLTRARWGEHELGLNGVHPCGRFPDELSGELSGPVDDALGWLDAERRNLVALCSEMSSDTSDQAWPLARAGMAVMEAGAHWDLWGQLIGLARSGAERRRDLAAQAATAASEGTLLHYAGDLTGSRGALDRAVTLYRSTGEARGLGYAQAMRAMTLRALSEDADEALDEALRIGTDLRDEVLQVEALRCQAWRDRDRQDYDAGVRRLITAQDVATRLSGARLIGYVQHDLGVAYRDRRETALAEQTLTSALQAFEAAGDRHWRALTLYRLSEVDLDAAQPERALLRLTLALETFVSLQDISWQASTERLRGTALGRLGDRDGAEQAFTTAARLADRGNDRRGRAIIDVAWADQLEASGEFTSAAEHYARAHRELQALGVRAWADRAADGLRRLGTH